MCLINFWLLFPFGSRFMLLAGFALRDLSDFKYQPCWLICRDTFLEFPFSSLSSFSPGIIELNWQTFFKFICSTIFVFSEIWSIDLVWRLFAMIDHKSQKQMLNWKLKLVSLKYTLLVSFCFYTACFAIMYLACEICEKIAIFRILHILKKGVER